MIVGGYSLHLYCDDPSHKVRHPHQFQSLDAEIDGPNELDCRRQARARGWLFRAGKCICPVCAKANRYGKAKGGE